MSLLKQRKKENNRTFSRNNPGYWHGRYDYVKEWRQSNPEYQRQWRQRKKQRGQSYPEIQAEILKKTIDHIEKNLMLLPEIQAEMMRISLINQPVVRTIDGEIQVHIASWNFMIENVFKMDERIHKRLPVEFVEEVLGAFNKHKISERDNKKIWEFHL